MDLMVMKADPEDSDIHSMVVIAGMVEELCKPEVNQTECRGVHVAVPQYCRTVGMRDMLVMPGGGYDNHLPVGQDGESLTPYPPHTPQSHSSSGLKSPDSGVNVSILE
ncbi:hypothetical protein OTU49_003219 [Cherax quadricarinatus]|uniref:Uncharacterized protein n=1 Tax=Cherax quadricarinatus TaxID=27406 RepID=A0AAW0XKV0_CHEQU